MRSWAGRRASSLLAVVLMMVVAACAPAATPVVTGPVGADLRAQVNDVERSLRGDLAAAEHAAINNAFDMVVARCMQVAGFDMRAGMVTAEEQALMASGVSPFDVWTFDDIDEARRLGYGALVGREPGPPPEPADPGRDPDVDAMAPDEQERFWLAFVGREDERVEIVEADGGVTSVAGGGCMGEADAAIWGDVERKLRLEDARDTADVRVTQQAAADRDVAAAVKNWRRCLADAGHRADDPWQAWELAADLADPDAARQAAVADAECKRSSGLSTVYANAALEAAREVLAEFDDQLIAAIEFERAALERARGVLGVPQG